MADKYQAAIIEYRAANLAIRALSKLIGKHLSSCSERSQEDGKAPHLKEAYRVEPDGMYGWLPSYDDPAEDYLKDACPHCYAAHLLIQERKHERQRFGVAKNRLMALGKALGETSGD